MKCIFSLLFVINLLYANPSPLSDPIGENKYFNEACDSLLRNYNKFSSEEIILKGDSLYRISINDWQRVKSIIVIIQGYEMQHNWSKALEYALQADSITVEAQIAYFRPKINGILGSIYNNLDLRDKGIEYLDKAFLFSKQLDRKNELKDKSIIYQRLSAIYHKQKDYRKSLSANLEALKLIEELEKEYSKESYSDSYIPVLMNIGVNYYNMEQYDLSKEYYRKAFKLLSDNKHNFYLAYWYIKYAAIELKLNNMDSAFVYIQKAKSLADSFNDKNLEFEVNSRFNDYYTLANDLHKSDSIKNRIIENYKNRADSKVNATKEIINQKDQQIEKEQRTSLKLIITFPILLLLTIAILYTYHKHHSKKIKVRFEEIIKKFQDEKLSNIEKASSQKRAQPASTAQITILDKKILSEKKISDLLRRLEDFENSTEFTTKNFTISSMASLFNTNIKYIHYILRQYRGKSFNEYINGIRINFIVKKMINDPEYLNYKIDYLSEISGYSSHSRFTQMFKKEIQMSPSEFISQLSRKEKKKY